MKINENTRGISCQSAQPLNPQCGHKSYSVNNLCIDSPAFHSCFYYCFFLLEMVQLYLIQGIILINLSHYILPLWCRRKESTCNARDLDSIPGSGRCPEGNGNPLQYSCLENPEDRGARWATVHGVSESDMTERLTLLLNFFFDSPELLYTFKVTILIEFLHLTYLTHFSFHITSGIMNCFNCVT